DLRGKSDGEVVAAMLSVADSRFQDDLLARAKEAEKIADDYEIPPQHRSNTPERLRAALSEASAQGLLPLFPFGSDFTEVELRLMPALGRLRSATKGDLLRLALRGGKEDAARRECLERMGLATPSGLMERVYRRLLLAALSTSAG